MRLCHDCAIAVNFPQVGWSRFKHQVQCVESCRILWLQHVVQLDNIAMVTESTEEKDLAQLAFCILHYGENLVYFLDGNKFLSHSVAGKDNFTVAASSDFFDKLILCPNFKFHLKTICFCVARLLKI